MAGGVLGICNLCVTLKANNLAAKKLGFFFAPLATAGKKLGAPKRLPPSQTLRSLLLLLLLLLLALIFPQPIAPTMQRLRKQPTTERWHICQVTNDYLQNARRRDARRGLLCTRKH